MLAFDEARSSASALSQSSSAFPCTQPRAKNFANARRVMRSCSITTAGAIETVGVGSGTTTVSATAVSRVGARAIIGAVVVRVVRFFVDVFRFFAMAIWSHDMRSEREFLTDDGVDFAAARLRSRFAANVADG